MPEFIILIDSREQKRYTFSNIKPKPKTKVVGLKTGDYSIIGFEDKIVCERKSLSDLFSSVGSGRARLEREFQRMALYDYSAIIIESSLSAMFTNPPARSKMQPKAVFRTLLSWSIKYHVHVWSAWDRNSAEKITYLLLKNFYDCYLRELKYDHR